MYIASIESLTQEIAEKHFPFPPLSHHELNEKDTVITPEMQKFYSLMDGCKLFSDVDSPFQIVGRDSIRRVRIDIFGEDSDRWGPSEWYTICLLHDGDAIAFDRSTISTNYCEFRDCGHEVFPDLKYCQVVARSFSEFLDNCLRSNGSQFWLQKFI